MKKKLLISLGLLLISPVSIYAYCEEFSHYFSPGAPEQTIWYVQFWMNSHDYRYDHADINADYTNAGFWWWQGWDINLIVYDWHGSGMGSDCWGSHLHVSVTAEKLHGSGGEWYNQTGGWRADFIVDNIFIFLKIKYR